VEREYVEIDVEWGLCPGSLILLLQKETKRINTAVWEGEERAHSQVSSGDPPEEHGSTLGKGPQHATMFPPAPRIPINLRREPSGQERKRPKESANTGNPKETASAEARSSHCSKKACRALKNSEGSKGSAREKSLQFLAPIISRATRQGGEEGEKNRYRQQMKGKKIATGKWAGGESLARKWPALRRI